MSAIKEIAVGVAVTLLFGALGQAVFWVIAKLMDRQFEPPGYVIGLVAGVVAGRAIEQIVKYRKEPKQ